MVWEKNLWNQDLLFIKSSIIDTKENLCLSLHIFDNSFEDKLNNL